MNPHIQARIKVTRKYANKFAYFIASYFMLATLIITLTNHLLIYRPHETMYWVLLSVIIILVWKGISSFKKWDKKVGEELK